MTKLEYVIEGLECHLMELSVGHKCYECPYWAVNPCEAQLIANALELLKEQEPVKPRYEDFFGNKIARCGNCNGYIVHYKYCPGCGKAVKWE